MGRRGRLLRLAVLRCCVRDAVLDELQLVLGVVVQARVLCVGMVYTNDNQQRTLKLLLQALQLVVGNVLLLPEHCEGGLCSTGRAGGGLGLCEGGLQRAVVLPIERSAGLRTTSQPASVSCLPYLHAVLFAKGTGRVCKGQHQRAQCCLRLLQTWSATWVQRTPCWACQQRQSHGAAARWHR